MGAVPLCKCHGAAMRFSPDARYKKAGGFWRCTVKHNAGMRAWYLANRDTKLAYNREHSGRPVNRVRRRQRDLSKLRVRITGQLDQLREEAVRLGAQP